MWVKGETLAIMRTIETTSSILLEVVLSWHWNVHGRYFIVKSLLTDVQQDIDGKARKEAERKWSLDKVRRSHC